MTHTILCGDSLELIKQFDKESVDLIVTSPPYWAKRIYNGNGELGTEPTPEEYVKKLADFFRCFPSVSKTDRKRFYQHGGYVFRLGRRRMEQVSR